MVVTPVVAFYLIYDWHRMLRTVDDWVPVNQRETVRELAREIDAAIAGFVRGQTAVCLILGSFYAVALTLSGLNFGLLIGLISGLITFIPYVGSMTGLVLAVGVAVAQFWPQYARSSPCSAFSWSASSSKAMCCRPSWSARASACIRSG